LFVVRSFAVRFSPAVRKIYLPDLKTTIKKIEDFVDGGQYLCCSGEKPAESSKLPPPFAK
jgi:hypothetical protein